MDHAMQMPAQDLPPATREWLLCWTVIAGLLGHPHPAHAAQELMEMTVQPLDESGVARAIRHLERTSDPDRPRGGRVAHGQVVGSAIGE